MKTIINFLGGFVILFFVACNPDDLSVDVLDSGECPDKYFIDTICYESYFAGLEVSDDLLDQYLVNAERFKVMLVDKLYDLKNPLWTIKQTGEWVIYFHIEEWEGPVTALAINNLTAEYELLANQWLEGLTDFDANAPSSAQIKVFGFVFNEGVQLDDSFWSTYGDYPIVTNWQGTDEESPWEIAFRTDNSIFDQNWYSLQDYDVLKVMGNRSDVESTVNYSPESWDDYVHPENVDMFYTKFWHKTGWDAVAQRQYLKIGGCITNYATGETLTPVFSHEMGHTFFHDDVYDRGKFPEADGLESIMNECCGEISNFDRLIQRIVWEAQVNQ